MSPEILKSFLVAIGFQIDDAKFKKAMVGIGAMQKAAVELGKATTLAAAAVTTAVAKVSKDFEDLYYASQRIHSTVENIRAVDYELSQTGGSAEGARAAMEGIASFMRSNPGGEQWVRGLGVDTRLTNGELRDTSDILHDLAGRFREMPYFAARVRASMLGIDERTLQAMIRSTGEFSDRYHDMAKRVGVDQQAAAEASHRLMVQFRDLLALLTLVADKIILKVQPAFSDLIAFVVRLDERTDGLSTTLLELAAVLGPILWLFRGLIAAIFEGVGGLAAMGGAAGALGVLLSGPVGWILALIAVIGAVLASSEEFRAGVTKAFQDGVAEITAALSEYVGAWQEVAVALKPVGEFLLWLFGKIRAAMIDTFGPGVINFVRSSLHFLATDLKLLADVVRIIADLLTGRWSSAWKNAGAAARDGLEALKTLFGGGSAPAAGRAPAASGAPAPVDTTLPDATPRGRSPLGVRNNNPGNLRRWGDAQVRGGFAVFGSAEEGLRAMAGNLLVYAKRHDDTVREIISKWAPSNENDTNAYINRVAKTLGVSPDLELNLRDPRTLARLMQAISRHENGGEFYGDSAYLGAANARLGVNIQQKTDIHVSGSGDPHATGRAVAGEQGRVNGDLVRNTRGAVG